MMQKDVTEFNDGKTKIASVTKTKALLLCGTIACPLFMLAVILEGAIRTDYSSFRYPLSSLSIGDLGWMQMSNFIVAGILLFVFSIGLKQIFNSSKRKFRGPLLISLVGIGLIGAGIFSTDPIYGYPKSKPLILAQFTIHGHLHDAFSILVFICLPAACFVFRKRFISTGENVWAKYSIISGFAFIVIFILTSMGFKQLPWFVDFAGLFQRICLTIGWTWVTLLALHLLRTPRGNSPAK
jgi:hypothetical protein